MKTFSKWITEEYVAHSDYNLEQKFIHFNRMLFDNKIPQCPITFDNTIDNASGRTQFRVNERRVFIPGSMTIKISSLFKRNEQGFDGIVIHELIHAFLAVSGHPDEGHGRLFQMYASQCSAKSGINIPREDVVNNLELASEKTELVAVILRRKAGKWMAAFFKPTTFDSDARIREMMAYYGAPGQQSAGDETILMKVNTNLAQKYGVLRLTTFGNIRFAYLPLQDSESLLQKGEIVRRVTAGSVTSEFAAEHSQRTPALVYMATMPHSDVTYATFYTPSMAQNAAAMEQLKRKCRSYSESGYHVLLFTTQTALISLKRYTLFKVVKGDAYRLTPENVAELKQNAQYIEF